MENTIQRSFILGDHWLYFKVYTGHKTSDLILADVIKPITCSLLNAKVISKWFFIRYADPQPHIRLRFYLSNPGNIGQVIQQLHPFFQQYMEADLIWKVQTDTYEREIERYGENTIELVENLFFHESQALIDIIEYLRKVKDEELRWLFALRATDQLLSNFQYDLEQKLALMKSLAHTFGQEFNMAKPLKVQLDKKYRNARAKVEEFMQFVSEQVTDYQIFIDVLQQNQQMSQPVVAQILAYREQGALTVDLDYLLKSLIHMLLNRIFKSKNRMNEMVCYNFLERYYKSTLARQKKSTKKSTVKK